MKNAEIHNGLCNKEIRDFLAKNLGSGYEGDVEKLERKIEELKSELEVARRSQAARDLIKLIGWKHFDVSDDIDDYTHKKYFNFVGTEEERRLAFGL